MAKKNIILGIVAGVAIASITAYLLSMNREKDDRGEADGEGYLTDHSHGTRLANKARHRAQHLVSRIRKQE